MSATTVDLAPPEINFRGVTMGLQDSVYWGLGTEDDPEDLTGRTVEVILHPGKSNQTRHTPTLDALEGGIYFTPPLLTDTARYLLLIAETPGGSLTPVVRGEITPGDRVALDEQ